MSPNVNLLAFFSLVSTIMRAISDGRITDDEVLELSRVLRFFLSNKSGDA